VTSKSEYAADLASLIVLADRAAKAAAAASADADLAAADAASFAGDAKLYAHLAAARLAAFSEGEK